MEFQEKKMLLRFTDLCFFLLHLPTCLGLQNVLLETSQAKNLFSHTLYTVLLDNYFNFPENYCRNQRSNKIFTHKSISMQRAVHSSNSILLHSGLNPAWHFWLSTRFSCCLKMKSVENILGYIREQFYRFSRGCKPRENL